MKLIGLIGGMSWHSSLEYYRLINELVSQRQGGHHSARVLLYSLEFNEVRLTHLEGRWDDAAAILTEAGKALKEGGADFLLICTNTMHKVAEAVEEGVGLPLLHIADATGEAIRDSGLRRVGLLGSQFTMEEPFCKGRIEERFSIEVLVPGAQQRAEVDRIVFEELCQGRFEASSLHACVRIIDELVTRGAEGVILGCTELPLLIRPEDVKVPLFDTARLHAEAAVDLALAEE